MDIFSNLIILGPVHMILSKENIDNKKYKVCPRVSYWKLFRWLRGNK